MIELIVGAIAAIFVLPQMISPAVSVLGHKTQADAQRRMALANERLYQQQLKEMS